MSRKRRRFVVLGVGALLLMASGSLGAYFLRHAMVPMQSPEKGQLALRVLVAAQGSTFKDRLVATLVAQLKQRPAHVQIIDVDALASVDDAAWSVIVIVHTWEFGEPPQAVSEFVARLANPGKIIDATTSDSGEEKLPGVDVISSASVVDAVPELVARINAKIDARLAKP
jgi:hypothetical protein